MGARPMARAIQDRLENTLAKKLLSGEIKKGSKIKIDAQNIIWEVSLLIKTTTFITQIEQVVIVG